MLRMVMCRHHMSARLQSCKLSVVLITLAKQILESMHSNPLQCTAEVIDRCDLNSRIYNLQSTTHTLQSAGKLLLWEK